jgi:hypothetical protein
MNRKSRKLFIVHCVDTEGPLMEDLNGTFERLKVVFGIDIKPSVDNLRLLREGRLSDVDADAVSEFLDSGRLDTNGNWNAIDAMIERLNKAEFRYAFSSDVPWVFTWFCLDHHGFTGNNPRNRDNRDHAVFDRYNQYVAEGLYRDKIQWHYHPLPVTGHYHHSGIAYLTSNNIWEILSKKVIQRHWFPSVFRPGFHTIRPDSHWFLEQWIPFDYGNQAQSSEDLSIQPDLSNGRYGDWRRAPNDWRTYHPSHDDYQSEGNCRRWIARCLNLNARIRQITEADIESAFFRANTGTPTVLSITNHDFRDIERETFPFMRILKNYSEKFPDVEVLPTDALNAMRLSLGIRESKVRLSNSIQVHSQFDARLEVRASGDLFGSQPYLAVELVDGRFIWENLDKHDESFWSFTFDNNHIPWIHVASVGLAANSISGNREIAVWNKCDSRWNHRQLND